MAYTRSLGKIALGCASTGLASQVYADFSTAHSLFHIPVVDDVDIDHEAELFLNLNNRPERKELLNAADVICWDEFLSNHKHCFASVYKALGELKHKIFIGIGDWKQIAPVVINGTKQEVLSSHFFTSAYWSKFSIHEFTKNLRLQNLEALNDPDITLEDIRSQNNYAQMLLDIGEGKLVSDHYTVLQHDEFSESSQLQIPMLKTIITTVADAIDFIHEDGFQLRGMQARTILAPTNDRVDYWNEEVQKLNPEHLHTLTSADIFDEVDDDKHIIRNMLSEDLLNDFNTNGVPRHIIRLKVNDICLVLRTMSRIDKLSTNTRVQIVNIRPTVIRVKTLADPPVYINLPRIRFRFRLPYGHSFYMSRTQFPLRLAYCMSYNKSQGQEFSKVLVDISGPSFSHGHTYVALSRIHHFKDIGFYCTPDQIQQDSDVPDEPPVPIMPKITNVVYNDIKNLFEFTGAMDAIENLEYNYDI
jgi:hypothetical protein